MNFVSGLVVPFEEAVLDASGGNRKVQKGDYLEAGAYPVVDQGQDLVGGYSDDEENLVAGNGPWVIFGDHTRSLKFMDQPFCMGADGVKVLVPRHPERLLPRYLYWFLVAHEVPSAGYSRHYKFLKRLHVPLPPLDEQRRIAAILDKADALRQKRRQAIAVLDSLTRSIFLDVFGDTIANAANHPTTPLGTLVDAQRGITYGIVQRGPDQDEGIDVVRISDFVSGQVSQTGLKRTTPDISSRYRRTILNGGEIVISIRGTIGRCAIVPPQLAGANVSREVAVIPITDQSRNDFYLALLRSDPVQRRITEDIKGVAQSGINLEDLRELPIVEPPMSLLNNFKDRSRILDYASRAACMAQEELEVMFASLQHRAFSGQL